MCIALSTTVAHNTAQNRPDNFPSYPPDNHCHCMHQGSALSPLLFVIVMEAISREFRVALPWELLYADDMVVIAENEEDLIKRLNEWKNNVENRGMRVNMN